LFAEKRKKMVILTSRTTLSCVSAFALAFSALSSQQVQANNNNGGSRTLDDFRPQNVHPLTMDQMLRAKQQFEDLEKTATDEQKRAQPLHRKLFQWDDVTFWNGRSSSGYSSTSDGGSVLYNLTSQFADSSQEYSQYSTAYRMLGGYIDCDHAREDSGDGGSGDDNGGGTAGCARWMMWAAYVNEDFSSSEFYAANDEGSNDHEDSCDHDSSDNENSGDNDRQRRERELNTSYNKYANDDNGYYYARGDDDSAYTNKNYDGSSNTFSNNAYSLDCGEDGSTWKILGVYRQEFYQFYEQISKHMWEMNDARYITALAGLDYMTDSDCQYVGQDYKGNNLYAGPQPLYAGYFQMGIYKDAYCIELNGSGYTYDDFVKGSCLDLNCDDDDYLYSCEYFFSSDYYYGSGNRTRNRVLKSGSGDGQDCTDDDGTYDSKYLRPLSLDYRILYNDEAKQVWRAAQEYTMYNFNLVYHEYMQCTPCMDSPTFQDGYFNGDSGYYEDDLINQCWKFYSHSSYTCNGDCQYLGLTQGTVNTAVYLADVRFAEGSTDVRKALQQYNAHGNSLQRFIMYDDREKFLSNTFLLFATALFGLLATTYHCMGGCQSSLKEDLFKEHLPDGDSDDEDAGSSDEDAVDYYAESNERGGMDRLGETDDDEGGGEGESKNERSYVGVGWSSSNKSTGTSGGVSRTHGVSSPRRAHAAGMTTRRAPANNAPGDMSVVSLSATAPQRSVTIDAGDDADDDTDKISNCTDDEEDMGRTEAEIIDSRSYASPNRQRNTVEDSSSSPSTPTSGYGVIRSNVLTEIRGRRSRWRSSKLAEDSPAKPLAPEGAESGEGAEENLQSSPRSSSYAPPSVVEW
jgi:hypothetical protein